MSDSDSVRAPASIPIVAPGQEYERPLRADLPQIEDRIHFRHPGYPAPFNKLFSLWRVERVPDSDQRGVHYTTALTACQIIANNAFDGYLAEQADGGGRVHAVPDSILMRSEYFFIVPDKPVYAIVPSFYEWKFPSTLPQIWRDAGASFGTGSSRCVVTGRFTVETAHLSPREARDWFANNGMAQYDPHSPSDVDSANNTVPLDCSLHAAMDKRMWAFAPRHGNFTIQTIALPKGVLWEHLCEFVHEYHGRNMVNRGRVEFLFARFAWTVLILVKNFLLLPRPKTLLARHCIWDDGELRQEEQEMAYKEINELFGGGGSKAASPRPPKRSRTASVQGIGDNDSDGNQNDSSEGLEEDDTRSWKRQRLLDRDWSEKIWDEPPRYERIWGDEILIDDEPRGRTETREDGVRHRKRRVLTSHVSPSGSIPSLADTETVSGASVTSVASSPRASKSRSRPKCDVQGTLEVSDLYAEPKPQTT